MKKFELSIPTPCHENWNAMTPQDKGRFCGSCQKTVIDFSTMSDRQVAEFFKKPAKSVCGHFHGDQLNRIIEVPRKRIPWIKYFFTIALPAFFLSSKASAQGEIRRTLGKVAVQQKPVCKDTTITPIQSVSQQYLIKDKLVNERGRPIPYLLGMIGYKMEPTSKEKLIKTISDTVKEMIKKEWKVVNKPRSGKFQIERLDHDSSLFNAPPFSHVPIIISKEFTSFQLNETLQGRLGGVVMSQPVIQKSEFIRNKKANTVFSQFSIFPNPVHSNSSFTIQSRKLENGNYDLSILTSTGEVVQQQELVVEKKTKQYRIQLQAVVAGAYFIRLINQSSGTTYTEIIIVQ